MTSLAIYPDQDLYLTSNNPILIYLNTQTPYSLTASFEKLEESEDFLWVRKMSRLTDQLYVLYLQSSDTFIALDYKADAEYLASLLEIPMHEIKVMPPQLSAGFLYRWTTSDTQQSVSYGTIELQSECGIYALTIAREADTENSEPTIVARLYETEMDPYPSGEFESERKGRLQLFGDRFMSDTQSQNTLWRWDFEKWTRWLKRFRDDLVEDVCLETDGMLLRFHVVRMSQSRFSTSQKGEHS